MALKGDLASVDLAQVFQMLALNKKVGLLSIQSPSLWKILFFDQRGVTLYYNEHAVLDRVVSALIRTGRLDQKATDEARAHSAKTGAGLQDSLLAGGFAGEQDLTEQMRWELSEEIYDLFFCKDARFEFFEGAHQFEGREGVVDPRFFFNTDTVIMEAARRIDEWSYISERIPNGQEVFAATGLALDVNSVEPECLTVLELVDGKRSVARIVEVSGLASFLVFKHLYQLLDGGFVAPLAPEQLLEAGNQCLKADRLQDAIQLFEKSLALGIGVPEVHARAATAYEKAEQFENAVYHLKCDAEYRIAASDYKGAMHKLGEAVRLVPTDLAARDRLVEIALGEDAPSVDGLDPVAEGKRLTELLMAVGDLTRVRSVLERLLRVQPDDFELKKTLVNVHTKAGDQKRVIELYEAIAEDLLRLGRPLEAIAHLQKILILDRTRTDVSERVRALYELDERTRSRRRHLAMLGALLCLLVAFGGVYWAYDRHADTVLQGIDVTKEIERQEFAKAARVYAQFIADFPLTNAIDRAKEELARIESMRKKYEAQTEHEQAAHARELEKLRGEYQAQWERHRELFLGGDPEGALQALTKVRELVTRAGESDDFTWALEKGVEKNWLKMQDYLEKSEQLGQRAADLMNSGQWQQARAAAVELLEKYEISKAARQVRVPVLLQTRPRGAQVLQHGRPIMVKSGDTQKPLTTPCVLLCSPWTTESFSVERTGFAPQGVTVDARKQAKVDVLLKVTPVGVVRFDAPVQTSVGIGDGRAGAGLRGGRVGFFQVANGKQLGAVDFAGLRAAESAPVIVGGRAFVQTNEGTIECLLIDQQGGSGAWAVRANATSGELLARDGRIVIVDRQNRLLCLDQMDGRLIWNLAIEGVLAAPPTYDKRMVRFATLDGRIRLVDASVGAVTSTFTTASPPSTRVFSADGVAVFGCKDGYVYGADEIDGRVLWRFHCGRAIGDGELQVCPAGALVITDDRRLVLLSRTNGQLRAQATFTANLQRSILVTIDRVFVTLRTPKAGKQPSFDTLQALDLEDLSVQWEYVDKGPFTGAASTDGVVVMLPDSNGDVVIFQ